VNTNRRPNGRDWIVGLSAGALLGAIFLGVGGRVGMRAIALAQGVAGSFTVEGTLTVIGLGTLSGAIVALIFLMARILFPSRRALRVTFFWMVTLAVVLRGLNPLTLLNIAIFVPLFLAHGSLLNLYWCRVYLSRRKDVSHVAPSIA
jgi:predicted Abi (CAAX) family protease